MEEYSDLDAQYNGPINKANAAIRNRFVVKVYTIVSVQLLITGVVAAPFASLSHSWVLSNMWLLWMAYGALLVSVFAGICCGNGLKVYPYNYVLLFCITASMGVVVGLITSFYSLLSVLTAVVITSIVFFGITAYACTTKTDFTGCGPYLCGFALAFLVFAFTVPLFSMMGFHTAFLNTGISLLGVILFTFYIIFDTQRIMGGKHKTQFSVDDYALAALELYLDIINLFLYILQMMKAD